MIDIPLVFIAGFLGSSHCIGMCGPFALALGSQDVAFSSNLARQSVYSIGRVFTYSVLGALAGYGGWRIVAAFPSTRNAPAVLAIVAGVLLLYQGILATGILRTRKAAPLTKPPCLASGFFANFLTAPGLLNPFLAGLFTGFLPCGLVYAFLALAAGTANVGGGLLTMVVFGAGTVPIMVLTGCSGSLLTMGMRRRLVNLAAWCIVLAGCVSIARGCGFVEIPGLWQGSGCPMCTTDDA